MIAEAPIEANADGISSKPLQLAGLGAEGVDDEVVPVPAGGLVQVGHRRAEPAIGELSGAVCDVRLEQSVDVLPDTGERILPVLPEDVDGARERSRRVAQPGLDNRPVVMHLRVGVADVMDDLIRRRR